MSDREKLIEILSVPIYPHLDADPVEVVADYLIDNGVTMQKWIPVSERLPKFGQPVLVSCAGYELDYVTVHTFWSEKRYDWVSVTHWMPLPEPPKECE